MKSGYTKDTLFEMQHSQMIVWRLRNRKRQDVRNMEFLKHNWIYLLLIVTVFMVAAMIWYLLFLAGNGTSYAGGMLVRTAESVKGMRI